MLIKHFKKKRQHSQLDLGKQFKDDTKTLPGGESNIG